MAEDIGNGKEYGMDDDDDEWIQEKGVGMHVPCVFKEHCPLQYVNTGCALGSKALGDISILLSSIWCPP